MRRIIASLSMPCMLILWTAGCAHHVSTTSKGKTVYGEKAEIVDRLRDSGNDLQQLANAPDAGIPQEVMESAKCVAVVPDMVKGGFVFGAKHGRGVATCRTAHGWSQPAFFVVTGGSWGAQIGVESVDLVMLVMNDQGMQNLLSSEFKLGANASIAAGPVGRDAAANTDWKFKSEILIYSRTHGLYAGIDLSGASIKRDDDSTRSFYGREVTSDQVLNGNGPHEPDSKLFLDDVRQTFHEAQASR